MKHGFEGCVFTLCAVIFASNGPKVNRIALRIHRGLQSRVKEQGGGYGSRQVRKDVYALSRVKEKEFLSRSLGCKGVGFSLVRCKPGEGAAYVHRHKVQEEVFITVQGSGSIILDGKRSAMPEGTIVRVGPAVYRAIGNDSNADVVYMILGAIPPKNFPLGGRTLLGDGIPNRKKVPRWRKRH